MSLSDTFEIDATKAKKGVPIRYSPDKDGNSPTFYVTHCADDNPKYTRVLEEVTRPFRAEIAHGGRAFNDTAKRLFREAFIKGCLVTWEFVPLSDVTGNKKDEGYAEFSIENATALFTRLPLLYKSLQEQAAGTELFKSEQQLEDDVKN